MAVFVDSGFRGGTDIVKALVMGAQAVAGALQRYRWFESGSLHEHNVDIW